MHAKACLVTCLGLDMAAALCVELLEVQNNIQSAQVTCIYLAFNQLFSHVS
jgi:hypothetical protein